MTCDCDLKDYVDAELCILHQLAFDRMLSLKQTEYQKICNEYLERRRQSENKARKLEDILNNYLNMDITNEEN